MTFFTQPILTRHLYMIIIHKTNRGVDLFRVHMQNPQFIGSGNELPHNINIIITRTMLTNGKPAGNSSLQYNAMVVYM